MGEWRPPILLTDAPAGEGVNELWGRVIDHRSYLASSGELERRRRERLIGELERVLMWKFERRARSLESGEAFSSVRDRLLERSIDPYEAADQLLSNLG
jgi:LAO/AO transport system kinase